jgi:nicotinamide mononucleotide adenylyltransferase
MSGMLDLSIMNIDKIVNDNGTYQEFFKKNYVITEKVDGIKLTVFRKDTEFNYDDILDNFIFAYKRTILYPEEYIIFNRELVKNESIGDAQFGFVFDKFREAGNNLDRLPRSTEFLIEFIVRKPTISRTYTDLHKMILISYAKSTAIVNPGLLTTFPESMNIGKVEVYSNIMKIDSPRILLRGKIDTFTNLLYAVKDTKVYSSINEFIKNDNKITVTNDIKEYFNELCKLLMSIESKYGGKMEGVVLRHTNGIYKMIQTDQHDKDHRQSVKMQWQMEKEKEDEYFLALKSIASSILKNPFYFRHIEKNLTGIAALAYIFKSIELPAHDKKTNFQIREDFYHVLKYLFLKNLSENNNCIFIGRFQPPTIAHIRIIQNAQFHFKNVIVAIVKGKKSTREKNPFSFDIQKRMILKACPDAKVIEVSTGNIISAINKSVFSINSVICGEDREDTYRTQLKNNPELELIKIKRSECSGTELRTALRKNDYISFSKLVHESSLCMFNELRFEMKDELKDI